MAGDRDGGRRSEPSLLLLDEPTAGLSPEETFKTGEMVIGFNRAGMTVVVVEHDMAFVRQIARQVTVLHLGRRVRAGHDRRDQRQRGGAADLSGQGPPPCPLRSCWSSQGLSAGYGSTRVLQGIDLAIRRGEIVAVIGRNGVGKTTMMRCLIGQLPVWRGSIRLRGEDIAGAAARAAGARAASATSRKAARCSRA